METRIYSVYDNATQCYMMPFYSQQNASAIRAVVTQLKDPNSLLAQHPNDFVLFCLGSFDDQNGLIENTFPPELVGKLQDYLELSIGGTRAAYPHPDTPNEHPALSDTMLAQREQRGLHGNTK